MRYLWGDLWKGFRHKDTQEGMKYNEHYVPPAANESTVHNFQIWPRM